MQEKWLYNMRKNLSEQMQCGVDWIRLTSNFDRQRIGYILSNIANTIIKRGNEIVFDRITPYYFSIVIDEIKSDERLHAELWDCIRYTDGWGNMLSDEEIKAQESKWQANRKEFADWLDAVAAPLVKSLPDGIEPVEGAVTPPQAPEGNSSTPEPQQKDLEYYLQKAVEKGYLKKADGGYRRVTISKAQLADLLNHFIPPTGKFNDKGWSLLFGESRLSKAADQLKNNRNGRCSHYEIIDALLKE